MSAADKKEKCFVIMPISDPKEYEEGHFLKIYEQIFKPAIESLGYESHRVDEDKSAGVIQAKIIKMIVEAPMVLCDLSTRNPNVLFELGIRQAFNKPVVLVQEEGTERIFDTGIISAIDYRKTRLYDEVIEDQNKIKKAIDETQKNSNFNSIINLIKMEEAKLDSKSLSQADTTQMMLINIINEISNIKDRMVNSENIKKEYIDNRINYVQSDILFEEKLQLLLAKLSRLKTYINDFKTPCPQEVNRARDEYFGLRHALIDYANEYNIKPTDNSAATRKMRNALREFDRCEELINSIENSFREEIK